MLLPSNDNPCVAFPVKVAGQRVKIWYRLLIYGQEVISQEVRSQELSNKGPAAKNRIGPFPFGQEQSNMNKAFAEHYTDREAAAVLGLSVDTLRLWRRKASGPPVRKFGGAVRYNRDELQAWASEQVIGS